MLLGCIALTAAVHVVWHCRSHVHILPRRQGDYQRNDDIYTDLEIWAPRPELQVTQSKLKVPEDGDRRDRTLQEMADEAAVYRKILEEYA